MLFGAALHKLGVSGSTAGAVVQAPQMRREQSEMRGFASHEYVDGRRRVRRLFAAAAAMLLFAGVSAGGSLGALPPDPLQIVQNEIAGSLSPLPPLQFPKDDSSHPGNFVEYWQWWLHLKAGNGHRFGAVVVFYEFPATSALDGSGHGVRRTDVRLTDLATGAVHAFSKWYDGTPATAVPNGFNLSSLGQSASGGGGNDRVHISVGGYSLELTTKGNRPPIPIEAANGVNRVDPLEMLQIYERWRMPTHGSITFGGRSMPVTGTSWFEHGWGNAVSLVTIQWDYFQLQLADGRDILVAQVRHAGDTPNFDYVGGIRSKNGTLTRLHKGDFAITSTGTWRRDATCSYPSGWIVTVKGQRFVVTPTPQDQEVRSLYGNFWDGETAISGASRGVGIAELLNYCYAPSPFAQLGS
jgi:predicted secreted hydrolase